MATSKVYGTRGQSIEQRLLRNSVELENGCREWIGAKNPKGYGNLRPNKDTPVKSVHRLAYQVFVGTIRQGLEIDHKCFNRACINPDHLQAVTHLENINNGRHNQNHGKKVCKWGHDFTPDNTLFDRRGNRACKQCTKERMRAWRAGTPR